MSKFIIEYIDGEEKKVEKMLKASEGRLKSVLALYFKVGYNKLDNNQFEFFFEPRAVLQKLIKVGGDSVETQMMAVGLQAMTKLNDKMKEDGIKARVIQLT